MIPPEFSEGWTFGGEVIEVIFTEFDEHAPAGHPGMITRVSRVLVRDHDADRLSEGSVLVRTATGISYEVKNPRRSGVGLTELDLHPVDGTRFERKF
jgi:hypothetical protein